MVAIPHATPRVHAGKKQRLDDEDSRRQMQEAMASIMRRMAEGEQVGGCMPSHILLSWTSCAHVHRTEPFCKPDIFFSVPARACCSL
jgi:hypothetical protein